MYTKIAVLALVASATATVNYDIVAHGPHAQKRNIELMARQTAQPSGTLGTSGPEQTCLDVLSSVEPLLATVPTPPPAIVSWESSATFTDICSVSIPASLDGPFSTYESQVLSWYDANSAAFQSLISACSALTSGIDTSTPAVCTGGVAGGSGGSGAAGGSSGSTATVTTAGSSSSSTSTSGSGSSGSGSGSGSGSSGSGNSGSGSSGSSSSASASGTATKNAGAQETALVSAAMLAAGFLGVVAAL
jgi:hypothetical protein